METIDYSYDAQRMFEIAIKTGKLSEAPKDPNFAGLYMFMGVQDPGTDNEAILFKHIDTRQYLKV